MILPISLESRLVRDIRETIANSETFMSHVSADTFEDAKDFVHVADRS